METRTEDELISIERQFLDIVDSNFSEDERQRLKASSQIASDLHQGKQYAHGSYDLHLLEVAEGLTYVGFKKDTDIDVIIAALFHDSVEDVPERLIYLASQHSGDIDDAFQALEIVANIEVTRMVRLVTNDPFPEDFEQTEENKIKFYVENLKDKFLGDFSQTNYDQKLYGRALAIKIIDTFKNTKRLHSVKTPEKRDYLRKKYTESLKVLEEAYKLHIQGNPHLEEQAEGLGRCLSSIAVSINQSSVIDGYGSQ